MPADRKADRHAAGNQTAVHARLDPDDFRRFEVTRERLGIKSRRQAIITAIREWLDRNETTPPESEER